MSQNTRHTNLWLTASSSGKCGKGGFEGSQTFEISVELD
jgi:hypothetical protein